MDIKIHKGLAIRLDKIEDNLMEAGRRDLHEKVLKEGKTNKSTANLMQALRTLSSVRLILSGECAMDDQTSPYFKKECKNGSYTKEKTSR